MSFGSCLGLPYCATPGSAYQTTVQTKGGSPLRVECVIGEGEVCDW